ncbi:MAG: acyltransferase [Oscillospiraceae bacterium]|jgi:surface polysaccharide O-acyltransferase-like enzyme|nr:acyltransferase [Oscillospiraceae bacterium]
MGNRSNAMAKKVSSGESKTRQSNFEALRIFAMLLIISFHVILHAAIPQLSSSQFFAEPAFAKKLLLFQAFKTFGSIGNAIFILIAGYFLIEAKKIDLKKQVVKIFSQLLFGICFMVLLVFVMYCFQPQIIEAVKKTGIEIQLQEKMFGAVTLQSVNSFSWFLGYYLAVIFIAELFLKKRLAQLSKNQYLTGIICVGALITFAFTIGFFNALLAGKDSLSQIVMGTFLFMVGGYIKLYNPFKNIKAIWLIILILLAYCFLFIGFYNTTMSNIAKFTNGLSNKFEQSILGTDNISFFTVLVSVAIFELFRRLNISNIKSVNYLASATLTIYLLHDNEFMYSFYRMVDWPMLLHETPLRMTVYLAVYTLIIFAYGVVIYAGYRLFLRLVNKKPSGMLRLE